MDIENPINERVTVFARYPKDAIERRNCIPMFMDYKNKRYIFDELCYVHPTIKGERTIHVFDVTDAETHFRLEHDTETDVWILKTMGYGKYVPGQN